MDVTPPPRKDISGQAGLGKAPPFLAVSNIGEFTYEQTRGRNSIRNNKMAKKSQKVPHLCQVQGIKVTFKEKKKKKTSGK